MNSWFVSELGFTNFQVQGATGKSAIKAHKSLLIFRNKNKAENQYLQNSIYSPCLSPYELEMPKHKTSEHSTQEKKKPQLSWCSAAQPCVGCLHSIPPTAVWVGLCSEEHRLQSTAKAFFIFLLSLYLPTNVNISKTISDLYSHKCIGWQIFSAALVTSTLCLKIWFGWKHLQV